MEENTYLISAIISVYKAEQFMEGRLNDLLAQTIRDKLEIIIIDSASPENEKEIIRSFQSKYSNIIYERTEERESIYKAWNRAIRKAQGKYITNANCDDRLRPDALETLAGELDKDLDVALVYGDFFITGYPNMTFYDHVRTGYSLKPDFTPGIMLSGCHMGPQPMWRREVHDEIGFFDEEYRASGDYEFWCRMAAYGYEMKHISTFLGLYLHNTEGIINADVGTSKAEERKVKSQYGRLLPRLTDDISSGFYYSSPAYKHEYANLCYVIDHVKEEFKRSLEALWKITRFPYCISVVLNGGDFSSREYCETMKKEGIIKNMIILDEKVPAGEALNEGFEAEDNARYCVKVESDISIYEELWLRNMVKRAFEYKENGVVIHGSDPRIFLTPRALFNEIGGFAQSDNEYILDYCLRVVNSGKRVTDSQGSPVELESFVKHDYTVKR